MDQGAQDLNELLVGGYEKVSAMEQHMLNGLNEVDVSISELHIMEYIASSGGDGRTISCIATRCGKTLPSITVAIQKLEKRGYVEKIRKSNDGRVVHVILTRRGKRIDAAHKYFHRKMINEVLKRIDDSEKKALINGLGVLNDFFDQILQSMALRART